MSQVFVRASRRARAYVRGGSSVARIKKVSGLLTKLNKKGPLYKSGKIASQRHKLYGKLVDERTSAVDSLYKKHRGGAHHISSTIRRASR